MLLAAGAWIARDSIADWMGGLELRTSGAPSERLAGRAEDRLNRIARDGMTEEARFSEAELQSLLTYRSGPALPPGIEDPRVDVQDTIIVLSARLRPDSLDGFSAPDALRSTMGDTTRVIAGVTPSPGGAGQTWLRVRSLQLGEFVVPPLMLPAVVRSLEQQGVRVRDGAIVVPLLPGVAEVRLEGDDIVLAPDRSAPD
ncbi:MAG: hypothetical protein ACODAB_05055 [Gemmatimonadota bacterium]